MSEMHDDGLPADFDWLTSQAKQESGDNGEVWWEIGRLSFTCKDHQDDPGERWVTVATDWQLEGEKLPKALVPRMRGQFRMLCELANS